MNWWGGQPFEDWIWNVAFDGIGSTVVATAVAVLFVLRQLRTDRAHVLAQMEHDQDLAREEVLGADCRALSARGQQLIDELVRPTLSPYERFRTVNDFHGDLLEVGNRLGRTHPHLQLVLYAAADTVDYRVFIEDLSPAEYTDRFNRTSGALQSIVNILKTRAVTPDMARGLTEADRDQYIEMIRNGASVNFNLSGP